MNKNSTLELKSVKNNQIVIWICISIICGCLFVILERKNIKEIINREERSITYGLEQIKAKTVHDISFYENGFTISGNDPYIVLDDYWGYIEKINIEINSNKIDTISLYLDFGQGFREQDKIVATKLKNRYTAKINKKIKILRIDIENSTEGIDIPNGMISIKYTSSNAKKEILCGGLFYFSSMMIFFLENRKFNRDANHLFPALFEGIFQLFIAKYFFIMSVAQKIIMILLDYFIMYVVCMWEGLGNNNE